MSILEIGKDGDALGELESTELSGKFAGMNGSIQNTSSNTNNLGVNVNATKNVNFKKNSFIVEETPNLGPSCQGSPLNRKSTIRQNKNLIPDQV